KSKALLIKLFPPLIKLWRKLDFKNLASIAEYDNESTRDYCLRVLNQELHDYLIDPILRINMLNKTHLASSGEIFWLLKSFAAPNVNVMANGTRTLAEALAYSLDVHTGSQVELVEDGEGGVTVAWRKNSEQFSDSF